VEEPLGQGDGLAIRHQDLARTTLAVVCLAGMIVGSLWVLRPFIAALIWAIMLVVATWPILLAVQGRLGGRRSLAVVVMTVVLLLGLVVPLGFAIAAIVGNAEVIVTWATSLASLTLPPPPGWLEQLPLIGLKLIGRWQEIAAHPEEISSRLAPYARGAVVWFLGLLGGIAGLMVQFLLIVAIAALLYARGEGFADFARRFASRLAGVRGDRAVHLAGQAIRAVALGVVVTALVQAALAGIGLALTGVPFAAVLTAGIMLLCIAQLGPVLVLLPAVAWLYWTGEVAWGTVLLVWTLIVGAIDNVLRPVLIRRGADLPLSLIIAGVIGGLIGFGIVGIFIGPVVLAVTYTLLVDWVESGERGPVDRALAARPQVGSMSP
jgi:predicted PurR-regulated permease PerM